MVHNYLRYAIVCPHLQLFSHQIKGLCHLNNKGGVCASTPTPPHTHTISYNNERKQRLAHIFHFLSLI